MSNCGFAVNKTMGLLIRTSQLNTELAEINVGVIYLDLLFELHVRDFHAWINLEIQRNKPDDLIYTRMEFYASRLISSQKNRVFTGTDYHQIMDVYSIWLLLYEDSDYITVSPRKTEILFGKADHINDVKYRSNIINVGVDMKTNPVDRDPFFKMIYYLLSETMEPAEKIRKLDEECGFQINKSCIERMKNMEYISDYIWNEGQKHGIILGEQRWELRGIMLGEQKAAKTIKEKDQQISIAVKALLLSGQTLDEIANLLGISVDEANEILEKHN
ncbi:hypothetical protein [Ileibacterium valens]|uniref:hypothetical protein n=2 Tax=Ileibacterium valens TaxID=1862668 RepID=UPI00259B2C97|nr:hypothetical protein [Ileibacterium valens]